MNSNSDNSQGARDSSCAKHEAQRAPGAVGDHAGLGAIATARTTQRLTSVTLCRQGALFHCPRRLVMRADAAGVNEHQAGLHVTIGLGLLQQARPDAQPAPLVEGLCCPPPRAQIDWDLALLRTVVVPPDDRLDALTQIDGFGFVGGTAGLDQRSQNHPLRVTQDAPIGPLGHH